MKKLLFIFIFFAASTSIKANITDTFKNISVLENPKKYEKVIFEDFDGKTINLEKFDSKIYIVNFWATWCAPCKKEMPSLDILSQDGKFQNLKIFAVNMETPNTQKTKKFFSELNIKNLEIYFDKNLNFVKEFKLRGVPTTILINKDGNEFGRIIGEVDFQDEKFLKWLLKYD